MRIKKIESSAETFRFNTPIRNVPRPYWIGSNYRNKYFERLPWIKILRKKISSFLCYISYYQDRNGIQFRTGQFKRFFRTQGSKLFYFNRFCGSNDFGEDRLLLVINVQKLLILTIVIWLTEFNWERIITNHLYPR